MEMRRLGMGVLFIVMGMLFSCDVVGYIVDYKTKRDNPNDPGAPKVSMNPTSGLVTSESGGTASFTAVLVTRPSADVIVGFSSSDTGEGTVNPASVVFTVSNWNVPQTVTVTGVDDQSRDGDQPYTVITLAAGSSDPDYNGLNPPDVSVTNTDNDTPGIIVSPASGLTTTEAGGTAAFTVVLNTRPSTDVSVGFSSNDPGEGTVSPASVVFTVGNWSVPQTVTVAGVDDPSRDGDQPYNVVTSAAVSGDPDYNGIDPSDVSVTNTDNDIPGIIINPTQGLVTTEAGGTAVFMVALNTQPSAEVTVGLSSSNSYEGNVSPASAVFTASNWSVHQTVTVTGVDDAVSDGDQSYTVITSAAVSADPDYNALNPSDVSVTNEDDEPGIIVTPAIGLMTTEAGGTAGFTVVLNTQPSADVTVGLTSSDSGEGTVSPTSVVFTAGNWSVPQTVTVTGVDDFVIDGDRQYTVITSAAVSSNTDYNGLDPSDVSVTNLDNDVAGVTVNPTQGLVTTEAGGTAGFTVVLNTQPSADVTVSLSSSDPGEGVVNPASVVFTNGNWSVPQTVTVTGVDDLNNDGDQPYTVITAAAVSADTDYNGFNPPDVSVINIDNEKVYIFYDDFEFGLDNWINTDWGVTNTQSSHGANCITDSPAGNYPPNAFTTIMTARNIDLTAADSPILSFKYRYSTNDSSDWFYVYASRDGGVNWDAVYYTSSTVASWVPVLCDLGAYKTSKVRIRFVVRADSDASTGDGVYIDEVGVSDEVQHFIYPFSDDFESGLDKWINTDWGVTNTQSSHGANCITDSPAGNYPPSAFTTIMTARNIDLTAADSPKLSFKYRYSTNDSSDWFYVYASRDGGVNWDAVYYTSSTVASWVPVLCNLGAYKTSKVRIRFVVRADSDASTGDGVYIDEVDIKEAQ
jgi:outer membrane protein assembly factor BamE (lipoprotein component of BamABCDE complex)